MLNVKVFPEMPIRRQVTSHPHLVKVVSQSIFSQGRHSLKVSYPCVKEMLRVSPPPFKSSCHLISFNLDKRAHYLLVKPDIFICY